MKLKLEDRVLHRGQYAKLGDGIVVRLHEWTWAVVDWTQTRPGCRFVVRTKDLQKV